MEYKESLKAYLEQKPSLSILWIVSVLEGCSREEFDSITQELESEYSKYLRWVDIPKIRRKLVGKSLGL